MANDINFALRIAGDYNGSNDLGSARFELAQDWSLALANGTGAGQYDRMYSDNVSIGPSSNLDLDLRGGLTDPFGVTLNIVELRAIFIRSRIANLNNLGIGGTVTNQLTGIFSDVSDQLILRPGEVFFKGLFPDGAVTLTAGTADLLRLTNLAGTNTISVDVLIFGTSA
jgi:hypothetical protein